METNGTSYIGAHGIPVQWKYTYQASIHVSQDFSAVFSGSSLMNFSAADGFFDVPAYWHLPPLS